MPVASLGYRTDLMMLGLAGAEITESGGVMVVRTPSNPDYWWGNFVLAPGPAALPEAERRFRAEFPAAAHVAIGIDGTDGAPGLEAVAEPLGLVVDRPIALTAQAVVLPPRPNAGAEYRRLAGDDDYGQCLELHVANNPRDPRAFHAERIASWRALAEAGYGQWYGAFVDGVMRAGLGVFTDGAGLARYQAVDTHPEFRRRGLAGTLVHHAALDALGRADVETLVIVSDPADDVLRVYRSVGFAGAEPQVQAFRSPPGYDD